MPVRSRPWRLANARSWTGSRRSVSFRAPYELAGKRIVFTNWYYIQPGDLDWRDAGGKSVYVAGNSGLFEADHVGINAPHGIRIMAEKPHVLEPFFRPHRMILQDGGLYKGWTDSDYYESKDAMQWERKAKLEPGAGVQDGFYQVFIDPAGPPEERFKACLDGRDRARRVRRLPQAAARWVGAACSLAPRRAGSGRLPARQRLARWHPLEDAARPARRRVLRHLEHRLFRHGASRVRHLSRGTGRSARARTGCRRTSATVGPASAAAPSGGRPRATSAASNPPR